MTAGEICKARGTSVSAVARDVGKPRRTILNWYADAPDLFDAVVRGVVCRQQERKDDE